MRRIIAVIAVVVSVAAAMVLAGPVMAQTSPSSSSSYTDQVQGLEYAAVPGQSGSFLGLASGQLPGVMNATVIYTGGRPGPNVTETITGGNWTLWGPWGALFGSFSGGVVQWNADATLADIRADLSVTGGSVNGFPVSGGNGTFVGVLDHRPLALGRPPTVSGTLQLTLGTSGMPTQPPTLQPQPPIQLPTPATPISQEFGMRDIRAGEATPSFTAGSQAG